MRVPKPIRFNYILALCLQGKPNFVSMCHKNWKPNMRRLQAPKTKPSTSTVSQFCAPGHAQFYVHVSQNIESQICSGLGILTHPPTVHTQFGPTRGHHTHFHATLWKTFILLFDCCWHIFKNVVGVLLRMHKMSELGNLGTKLQSSKLFFHIFFICLLTTTAKKKKNQRKSISQVVRSTSYLWRCPCLCSVRKTRSTVIIGTKDLTPTLPQQSQMKEGFTKGHGSTSQWLLTEHQMKFTLTIYHVICFIQCYECCTVSATLQSPVWFCLIVRLQKRLHVAYLLSSLTSEALYITLRHFSSIQIFTKLFSAKHNKHLGNILPLFWELILGLLL